MGAHGKPAASHRSSALRPAIVLLGGAVCAAVAGTTPALADGQPINAPVGQLPVTLALSEAAGPGAGPLGVIPFGVPPIDAGQPNSPGDEPARIVSTALGLTPAVPAHAPSAGGESSDPVPATTPVADPEPGAPTQANRIRIGSVEFVRPSIVAPEQAAQINAGAAEVEDALSDVLNSSGVEQARSDKVAARMIGDAAIGAVVGGVVIAPVAATVGAIVGGVVGFVLGIPFLPTGLVVGPVVGAIMVGAFVVAPAIVAGAVIGAGVGAVEGWNAPLDPPSVG
ncbi:hypothetical protein OG874_13650 [Nocardia sp. NBC_00565]|uniref:hypothetical protein n=1 Tax=Nocardia sp. NBC_00565 TaxID=2975993 RepID=UPI002E822FFD|nr:hypothetical protein [Nocardia sp. NBC_00565]WUC06112.1 hypothetical protein OG874_13650 [Nocardia sp. NBC_00565]